MASSTAVEVGAEEEAGSEEEGTTVSEDDVPGEAVVVSEGVVAATEVVAACWDAVSVVVCVCNWVLVSTATDVVTGLEVAGALVDEVVACSVLDWTVLLVVAMAAVDEDRSAVAEAAVLVEAAVLALLF